MPSIAPSAAGQFLGDGPGRLAQPAGELEGERDRQIAERAARRDLDGDLREHRIVGRNGIQAADGLGEAAADGVLNR